METLMKIIGWIVLIIAMSILAAIPLMLLWNALMPDIFGIIEISFWQALGLMILSSILFKSSYRND